MTRLLIVDDSPTFIHAARELLERQGMTVVGEASTSDEAVRLTRELRPDLTLVDVDLGDENGFELAPRLVDAGSPPSTLVMTSVTAEQDLSSLIDHDTVAGFVGKARLSAATINAVTQVMCNPRPTGR
jgi:DNA-binding NarL/FixJ family response regulator